MLIDSHCHIHDPEYHFDTAETLSRARYASVEKIIVIGTSPQNNQIAQNFAENHQNVFWSYGFHPEEDDESIELPEIANPIAIGEIGLDYHYQPCNKTRQTKLLETMLDLAKRRNLPVIFHVREAFDDFWPIIDNQHIKNAVLHSFSDNQINLESALNRDFYIGVNGLATFAEIPLPPLSKMLLETDAPYLTPKPFRGKINEPSYIKNIAEWVAEKLQVPFETVAEETSRNVSQLFNI